MNQYKTSELVEALHYIHKFTKSAYFPEDSTAIPGLRSKCYTYGADQMFRYYAIQLANKIVNQTVTVTDKE